LVNWDEFRQAAPPLATLGLDSIQRFGLILLGTIRADGTPRISPVEPVYAGQHLLLGMMWRSQKALDLLRDARYLIHSVVTSPDAGEGEFKLRGRAVELAVGPYHELIRERWRLPPARQLHVFSADIESAAFVCYDLVNSEMIIKTWNIKQGPSEVRRPYP
jgi:hypothetical protein